MGEGIDHHRNALRGATNENAAEVHALLYVGEQLEVIAGILGGGNGRVKGLQEWLTAEEGIPHVTEGQRVALRYAVELCEELSADGREVYRNVPVRQTADALRGLIDVRG